MEAVRVKMSSWNYPESFNPKDYSGFIYCIRNNLTGVRYIGKKTFWFKRKVVGKKRRKTVESDWKNYWGSSEGMKEDILDDGKEAFTRDIMLLIPKGYTLSYWEDFLLYQHDVLGATDKDGVDLYRNERIASYRNQSRKCRIPAYFKSNPIHRMCIEKDGELPEGWVLGNPDYTWKDQLKRIGDG